MNFSYRRPSASTSTRPCCSACCLKKEKMLSGEIADELQLSRSNASKVIASLEKEAYIRRNVCPHDSRCMSFHLTKKGRELIDRIHCSQFSLPEELRRIAESMTEEEITTNNIIKTSTLT